MRAGQTLPPILWPLTALSCLGFGGLALLLGMDAGWDLRNHHYYNGWALLNGMVGKDLLVSQVSGFLNPTLDAVYVAMAQSMPAWALGFVLGMLHGLNYPLLFAIGWRVLEVRNPNRRVLAAGALALAGVLGAGGLAQVGTVFADNVISLGVLAAAVVVTTWWEELADGSAPIAASIALLAGVPAGLALGLNGPAGVFCLGLGLAFLAANLPVTRRMWLVLWFAVGVVVGVGMGGGHWMAYLWHTYGNPVFPFFNQIFHSPWALPQSYLGQGFREPGLVNVATFGWRFPFEPLLAAEVPFRDFRILAVITLLPLAVVASLGKRDRDPGVITVAGPTGWLLGAAAISYTAWVALSCTYRHLVALEMLAPMVVVAAVGCLPLPRAARRGLSTALVAFLVVTTLPGTSPRVAWADRAVEATVPVVDTPDRALVLLSGRAPLSFLVPLFPGAERMRFHRIESDFAMPDDPERGFRGLLNQAVALADGPIYSLHVGADAPKLAEYSLELDPESCVPITSPIGMDPYRFCLTRRPTGTPREPASSAFSPAGDGSAGSAGLPAQP